MQTRESLPDFRVDCVGGQGRGLRTDQPFPIVTLEQLPPMPDWAKRIFLHDWQRRRHVALRQPVPDQILDSRQQGFLVLQVKDMCPPSG